VGPVKYKVKRKQSVREQRSRRTIINSSNRKERIRPMDIVSICHEISSNKRKVFDEVREVFRFSQYSRRRYTGSEIKDLCKERKR
jgi:hypothetical protein